MSRHVLFVVIVGQTKVRTKEGTETGLVTCESDQALRRMVEAPRRRKYEQKTMRKRSATMRKRCESNPGCSLRIDDATAKRDAPSKK